MICTPESRTISRTILIAMLLGAASLMALSAPLLAEAQNQPAELIAKARQDLARGDGIAAEIHLDRALHEGATRESVAAFMGDAFLKQGKPDLARKWLGPGRFSKETAAAGFRALARLEQSEGHLAAAGRAFDRAIMLTPNDATMWVEIGRLRYVGGEHVLALEAADYALELDPENVRALEFSGQIVRDRYGLRPALGWFEAALAQSPDDISILGEYAATLGDLGRSREMLSVTRRMLELEPGNSRAYYLQAIMAARAGKYALARTLLNKTRGTYRHLPGAMLLEGIVEVEAGNYVLAADVLERLARRQPANENAQLLLARALFLDGEYEYLIQQMSSRATSPSTSAYLLTVLARAHEQLGQRDKAGLLLDRAAVSFGESLAPVGGASEIAGLIAEGRLFEAEAIIEQARMENPGFYENQSLAGDVQLALGRGEAAIARYKLAARIRMPATLMKRMALAYHLAGRDYDAAQLVGAYLYHNPTNEMAIRLSARHAANAGDWNRSRMLLQHLRQNGGGRDVGLLAELSFAQLRTDDVQTAQATAQVAQAIQPSSPIAAQAWGLSLAVGGEKLKMASSLLAKARKMMGDNPLLAEGRLLIAGNATG